MAGNREDISDILNDEEEEVRPRPKDKDDENIIEVTTGMSTRLKLLIALLIIVVIVAAVVIIRNVLSYRSYNSYKLVSSYQTTGESTADYYLFADNVLKVSKEGASYIDASGDVVWDCGYSINLPEVVVNGDYAVVADINGRDVYVFDTSGKISSQTLDYDITNVDVASQGVYAVIVTTSEGHMINVYDKYSDEIYDHITYIENSGYPLDVAISSDGTKLFTSYLNIVDTSLETYLAAYNLSDVGKNENSDRLVGGYTFEGKVFPIVEFMDNDTVACFGDDCIEIYSMSEKPSLKAEIDLGDVTIQGIFCSEEYVGYIEKLETQSGSDDAANYNIYVYDTSGKLESTISHNGTYSKVTATSDELIVVGDFDCAVYYYNGTEKFSASFTKSLINFVPYSERLEYIVVFEDETQFIKLYNDKDKEE